MIHYLVLVSLTWLISQTLKFIIQLIRTNRESLKRIRHIYIYSSGPPSTHAAVLTASLSFLIATEGTKSPSVFVFFLFSVFWIYEIYLQRSRLDMLLALFKVRNKKTYKILQDYNGHSLTDLTLGIMVGYICFCLFSSFFI